MPKTPAEMIEAVTRNLPKNTGKTADEWKALLKAKGPKERGKPQYTWLRAQGLPHVASLIFSGGLEAYEDLDALVDAQYAGPKAELRPIYEAVLEAAKKLGKDVEERPCKTYVPLRRSKAFALMKAEKGRIDLGFRLGAGVKPEGRLTLFKRPPQDAMTHKIELTSVKDVDREVARWLKAAYDEA